MLFNSFIFAFLFLPVTLVLFLALGKWGPRGSKIWSLIVCSLIFYTWWYPPNTILLVLSILVNFQLGRRLQRSSGNQKRLLAFGVSLNLANIAFFKYAFFFSDIFGQREGLTELVGTITLPLAISFYTFQQITYLVDSSRGLVRESSFRDYLLYVCFFPQLIAGPIVHHAEVMPQFKKLGRKYDVHMALCGFILFAIGLIKKVLIADAMAEIATPVFDGVGNEMAINAAQAWSAALGYTLQLYFDFSGYSDMAIGLGLMFNIALPQNFNSPYKARSIIDFWRRWHMTLSQFLRDYLYIPLGGNRNGKLMRYRNLMLTMLLGGLWHGAGWAFVAWGFWHGLLLCLNQVWIAFDKKFENLSLVGIIGSCFARPVTLLAVIVGWVLFRAEDFGDASEIIRSMFGFGDSNQYTFYDDPLLQTGFSLKWSLIVMFGVATLVLPNSGQIHGRIKGMRIESVVFLAGAALVLVGLSLLINLGRLGASEFIYFNF